MIMTKVRVGWPLRIKIHSRKSSFSTSKTTNDCWQDCSTHFCLKVQQDGTNVIKKTVKIRRVAVFSFPPPVVGGEGVTYRNLAADCLVCLHTQAFTRHTSGPLSLTQSLFCPNWTSALFSPKLPMAADVTGSPTSRNLILVFVPSILLFFHDFRIVLSETGSVVFCLSVCTVYGSKLLYQSIFHHGERDE